MSALWVTLINRQDRAGAQGVTSPHLGDDDCQVSKFSKFIRVEHVLHSQRRRIDLNTFHLHNFKCPFFNPMVVNMGHLICTTILGDGQLSLKSFPASNAHVAPQSDIISKVRFSYTLRSPISQSESLPPEKSLLFALPFGPQQFLGEFNQILVTAYCRPVFLRSCYTDQQV